MNMNWSSWLIVIVPLVAVFAMAFYARRYVRDIADYLAAGRVAGRYVIAVGDMSSWLSVITLVALCEQNYQCGMAIGFWAAISIPLGAVISLSGYCVYRFRQTKCLSVGQFFEQRYSRSFRIVASAIRTLAEMLTNAIGPAVAVRFFIYFLGISHSINLFGWKIPTYGLLVGLLLLLALAIVWPAGRISLLMTDCLQGIISYPIFVVFTVFVLVNVSWFSDVTPVMLDRVPGESFLNPMDISELRDFNMFALFVTLFGTVLNRAAWLGNGSTGSGKTAHEQKMANILGTWRNGFASTTMILIGIFIVTYMLGGRFSETARDVRVTLGGRVADEVVASPEARDKLKMRLAKIPAEQHVIGKDAPYSRKSNPDVAFLTTAHSTLKEEKISDANAVFQQYRSLYNQMMMPILLGKLFPPVLAGLFLLLMLMMLLSTDDTRIFNASSTIVQDIILPLRKTPLPTEKHLRYIRGSSVGVTVFFFVVSLFFSQLDYINMFITIMCSVWLGAAGPIMLGGLYTRFGTTCGAWCALIFGSGTSIIGLMLQRNWADLIYPFLDDRGLVPLLSQGFEVVSKPFHPYVVWSMDPVKFPINSMELYFIAMVLGIAAYVIGSLVSFQRPYNLDRLLHRKEYADAPEVAREPWEMRRLLSKLIGITPEYTRGDKAIAWSVFAWSFGYKFFLLFLGVLIWNAISPWSPNQWGVYFFLTTVVTMLIVGSISTVWFFLGGLIDMGKLIRALETRVGNPLDNGQVEGNVSLSDKRHFDEIEKVEGKSGDDTLR
ncbi:MAG: hypothetical protein PHS41_02280 [Victivallaceae bacterium]|nr:hypothetical protein [Victivallaceae bacterium]